MLLALVFWAAIGLQRELARLRQGLPYLLDEQIRKGYELEKDLRAPGGDNHVKRVLAWNNKTHELLLAHAPVHAEDVTKNLDIKVKDKQSGDLNWERDAALELLRGTIAPLKKVRKQV